MMRRLLLGALAAAPLLLGSAAASAGTSFGEHGMALFGGKDGLYAAHLPMFHAPHDYQVVLQLHIADHATDAALRARLHGKTALWTLAPEQFDLDHLGPRAQQQLQRFKADLVEGHFEQGGKTQFGGALVVVDKVLLFRQLSPAAAVRDTARYVQIGSGKHRYLIKQIDSRPDFDHIVAYDAPFGAGTDAVSIPKPGLGQPSAARLAAALGLPVSAIRGAIYYSTGDLK